MRSLVLLVCLCGGAPLLAAEAASTTTVLPVPDSERDGRELATRLRTSLPARETEFKGVLVITPRDGPAREISITTQVELGPTNWQVIYRASPQGQSPAETLAITHRVDGPNTYQLTLDTNATSTSAIVGILRGSDLARPFVGSDFSALDLGLEFLHWPQQRKLKHEMRSSRSCHVLESVQPKPDAEAAGYARVVSWVDVESGGIIHAEAYDRDNKLVKAFKVGSLRKVEGQYQVETLKIRSTKTGQETELKFDLRKKP